MNSPLTDAKKSILSTCRYMVSQGLTMGTWGNISIFCPELNCLIITPSGMDYETLEPDDMVAVNLSGTVTEGCRRPSIETPLHLAVYRARSDVQAIVHTHSVFATAAAVARVPVPPIVEDMAQIVGGSVEVADYAPPGSTELADNVVTALGHKAAVLMANHGLIGVGAQVDEALTVCQVVEKGARIFAYARMLGQPVVLRDEDVKEMHLFYKNKYKQER